MLKRFFDWAAARPMLVAVLFMAIIFCIVFHGPDSRVDTVDRKGAKDALIAMKDWAVWMAGIQFGSLVALGSMFKEEKLHFLLEGGGRFFAIEAAIFNGTALLFSAWQLTSLSSMMLRMQGNNLRNYDFYMEPLYKFMEESSFKIITLGKVSAINHWFWFIGILLFAALVVRGCLSFPHTKPYQFRRPGENQ